MTIKTPYDHPLDNSLLTREERLEGQAAYRRGYADAQARAEKLAEALRDLLDQGDGDPLYLAWGERVDDVAARAALQEWDAAQKGGADA